MSSGKQPLAGNQGSNTTINNVIIGTTVGIGGVCFLAVIIYFCRRADKQDRSQSRLPPPATVADLPRIRNQRGTSRHDVDGLPTYKQHRSGQLVSQQDVQYDVPAAFDLAEAVALSERARAEQEDVGRMTTYERMRRVQVKIAELKRLTAAAPAQGYPAGSPKLARMDVLRVEIVQLMDPDTGLTPAGSSDEPVGEQSRAHVCAGDVPDSLAAGPSNSQTRGTLYERMLELQQLLARIESLQAEDHPDSASTTRETIRELRVRVDELMDVSAQPVASGSTSAARDEGSGEAAGPQGQTGGVGTNTITVRESGEEGESGGRAVAPPGLPPPYSETADVVPAGEQRSPLGAVK
ncbi:hypothetical protein FA15DRAFT_760185 [Coprinopsis marcescibilis]|uniref:Uncharacterized protein n=1 Tax=Coprinopsis marcescibilis TaxID=230819 RepID=A0A5C3KGB5_COPMA|nr:hypothetical protein FA15DRAFT_760185 [Coprinopsis marcescibilis]